MTSPPPRRRFAPEPLETSTRTSRPSRRGENLDQQPLPESGVEQSSTSSNPHPDLLQPDASSSLGHDSPLQPNEPPTQAAQTYHFPGEDQGRRELEKDLTSTPSANSLGNTGSAALSSPPTTKSPARRRFKAEPLETSTKSSHSRIAGDGDVDKPRAKRRFAPQPVETSEKSHRKSRSEAGGDIESPEAKRKSRPEPVEVSTRIRQSRQPEADEESPPQLTRRRFAPEPVENTTTRRRRKKSIEEESSDSDGGQPSRHSSVGSTRKFSPELVETARGSYRKGSSRRSTHSQTDDPPRTASELLAPEPPAETRPRLSDESLGISESRFSAANLTKKQTKQHSFIVPDLPCIDSDSSGEHSGFPSPSESASPLAAPEESLHHHYRSNLPDRRDDSFRKHILSEAAETAEKRLREQALAAFPNEQVHHSVHHFAGEESDEETRPGKLAADNGVDPQTFRRESAADLVWHMKEMRKHHEQLETAKKELKEDTAGHSRFSAAALSARHRSFIKRLGGPSQKGVGLTEMRNAASPPMAGDDLVFPLSQEPCNMLPGMHQASAPKKYNAKGEEVVDDDDDTQQMELWSAKVGIQQHKGEGLWMDLCHVKEQDKPSGDDNDKCLPTILRSGLMTPAIDIDNDVGPALESVNTSETGMWRPAAPNLLHPLPTPQSSQNSSFADSVTQRLNREIDVDKQIEQEFHSEFITQIYNYLSLGYPSLARAFDDELSKISRIPVDQLRQDDGLADAKGYVGAPEGVGLDQDAAAEGKCARWTALRLYIHEWARQQPDMVDKTPAAWGVHGRRGSWAV